MLHAWRRRRRSIRSISRRLRLPGQRLVTLYEADFDERWLDEAVKLADEMLRLFEDNQHGGFFYTAIDGEQLIVRQKDFFDSSVPSGNSLAATVLVRLAKLTGDARYLSSAEGTLAPLRSNSRRASGQLLFGARHVSGADARDCHR